MKTCETCRFWGTQFRTIEGRKWANCQRNAPRVMPYHPGGYTDQVDSETVWARTENLDFCGDHSPKPQPDRSPPKE